MNIALTFYAAKEFPNIYFIHDLSAFSLQLVSPLVNEIFPFASNIRIKMNFV